MLLFYRAECLLLANTRAVYFTFTFIMGNGDATRTLNISAPTHILAVAVAWNMEKFYIMHLDNFEIFKYLPGASYLVWPSSARFFRKVVGIVSYS